MTDTPGKSRSQLHGPGPVIWASLPGASMSGGRRAERRRRGGAADPPARH